MLFQLIAVLIFGVKYSLWSWKARNFLHHPVTHRPLAPNILCSTSFRNVLNVLFLAHGGKSTLMQHSVSNKLRQLF